MKPLSGLNETAFWGKLLYGLLFCLLVPVFLVIWAIRLEPLQTPMVPAVPYVGLFLIGIGLILIAAGMQALWVHGRGLPMNAYPPTNYVRQGVFRWLSHPIYVGFVLACFGVSLAAGSGAGLWVVTPIVVLACTSLVWGYERPDLVRRFGDQVTAPWLRLPSAGTTEPSWQDRISVVALVLLPWLMIYEMVEYIGVVQPVLTSTLTFETDLPVWGASVIPYALVYPLVALAPFAAQRQSVLRNFAVGGLVATALTIPFYLTVPVVAPFRELGANTPLSDLLLLQQQFDRPVTAFPAFHVIWLLLAVRLYIDTFPGLRIWLWLFAGLAVISCWTTGMHAIADVVAGIAAYVAVTARQRIWRWVLVGTEGIANSWKEWRIGPIRIINHGIYAGMGATVGFLIVGYFLGGEAFWASLMISVSIVICAGIWGQILVGSKKLLRPFGYYGGVIGAGLGIVLANWVFAQNMLAIGAALAIAAPWVQAIGRFRCLVQGCCHGAKTCDSAGICYRHERSRVLQVSGLEGQPLHPTPVYSMLSNVLIGLILIRLLLIGAPASFVIGCYLMFNGLARFVEEAYRGEPQTQIIGGLKIYQWTALTSFMAGSIFTMFPSAPVSLLDVGFTSTVWIGSIAMGVFVSIAMGVDWPESNRRFSRLI